MPLQKDGTWLMDPPQIPQSIIMSQAGNPELFTIYASIINSERIVYRNALRKLHSCDYQEVPNFIEIPDEKGNTQKVPNPEVRIQKLPSARRRCRKNREVLNEDNTDYLWCYKHNSTTDYVDWDPPLNEIGFNMVASAIIEGTDEIMSTGNINTEEQSRHRGKAEDNFLPLKNLAFEKAIAICDTITENAKDWSIKGEPKLTEGMYLQLYLDLATHFYFVMTRANKAFLLEKMSQTSQVSFSNPQVSNREPGKEQNRNIREIFLGKS